VSQENKPEVTAPEGIEAKQIFDPEKVKALKNPSVGTYDRKPMYRPKPLALMIHRAIIEMRGTL